MRDRAPRILVIDDDQGFCALVSKHLTRAKFEPVCVFTAEEGFAKLQSEEFDAVVLDHVLPEHDGLVVLHSLRAFPDAPPIVYLTGSEESRIAVAALKAGASDYVIKDLNGDFLILLEAALDSSIAGAATRRAKEAAEAEVRQTRDQFKALADERALMLKEVNHRVSNSLQLIASLLHFQGEVSSTGDIKSALKEAQGRVLAVARVHRSLYTSHDVRWVSLGDYLSTLTGDLGDVSSSLDGGHTIRLDAEPWQAGPDIAVSIGIVTTELVLNALKHAYPDGQGEVRVGLKAVDGVMELSVEDDGVGSGGNGPSTGLGKRIIRGMADKLDATLVYDNGHPTGVRAILHIPLTDEIRLGDEDEQAKSAAA